MIKKCPMLGKNEDCIDLKCMFWLPSLGADDVRYGKCAIVVSAEANLPDNKKTENINLMPSF